MIQAKCIQKFRDKSNKIYGYRLQDINGQTQDVRPDKLKQAIANKQIHVVNLTLTSDDRLVDTTEKQLQNKKILGKAPIIKENDPSKMEAFMLQVARTIFKSLGLNGEAQEAHGLDNSYGSTIDKRYDIPGQYMYFDGEKCILAIMYDSKDNNTGKQVLWIAVDGNESSLYEICTKSMSKDAIKSTIDKFIKDVKPHISA